MLKDTGGNPINGSCDFRFLLYDAEVGGGQVGPIQEKTAVSVVNGYFDVSLDFGNTAFTGEARWLGIAVKCNGETDYTSLSPRQPLTPAPYASYAPNAGNTNLLDGQSASAFANSTHTHWGAEWTGSGIGLTLSGGTTGLSASGSSYGLTAFSDSTAVYGESDSTTDSYGIYGTSPKTGVGGYATATSGWNTGVYGFSASTDGQGVQGFAGATSGTSFGMLGLAYSPDGYGVYGHNNATTGNGIGVTGESNSTTGYGVYGKATATNGKTVGVFGKSDSTDGTGVYGYATATSGITYGVYGKSNSTDGKGLFGYAGATTGVTYGVYAQSKSDAGIAVYGEALASTGTTYGVYGHNGSTAGAGLYGLADLDGAYTTAGVYGRSDAYNGFGVAGYAPNWDGVGVGAWSNNGRLIEAFSGYYPGGTLEFYVTQGGDVYANGTYNFFKVSNLDGATHALASIQSPEVWMEDFGRANLVNGLAVVTIAPDFAGIANLSADYLVFITLEGDCQGVYISNKTPTSFEVHEVNNGKSNAAFSYLIVAKLPGSETVRLPKVTLPASVDVSRQQPDEGKPPEESQP